MHSGMDGWTDGWTDGQTDGQTDGRMDGRNFSPFHWFSSPIGADALLYIHVNYQIFKQGKGTADHMMPWVTGFLSFFPSFFFFLSHSLFLSFFLSLSLSHYGYFWPAGGINSIVISLLILTKK